MFKGIQEKLLLDHGVSSVYLECITDIMTIREREKVTLSNSFYMSEGTTEISTILNGIVDIIRDVIKQLYQALLEAFDYYILNEGVNLSRYIEHIKKQDKSNYSTIRYMSYEYDKFNTYPKRLNSILDVNRLIKKDTSVAVAKTTTRTEYLKMLETMTDISYGSIPAFSQIKTDFEKKMRGREVNAAYSDKLIEEFLENYQNAKKTKTEIIEERRDALDMIKEIEDNLKELEKMSYDKNSELVKTANYKGIDVDIEGRSKELNATLIEYNTFYSDILKLIEMLYTSKVALHRERLNAQKLFVLACLKEVNIVDMNKRRLVRTMTTPPLGVKGDKLTAKQADLYLAKK